MSDSLFGLGFIVWIISLITWIVFLVMAAALSNISTNLKEIRKMLKYWMEANGYGTVYTCSKCRKNYAGKQIKCPNCGDEKEYM